MRAYVKEISYSHLPQLKDCNKVLYVRLNGEHTSDYCGVLYPGKLVKLQLDARYPSDPRLLTLTSMSYKVVELLGERIVIQGIPGIHSDQTWGYTVNGYLEWAE